MSAVGYQIAQLYTNKQINGWAENDYPGLAKESFNLLSSKGVITKFSGFASRPKTVFLYRYVRKVLGKDIPNVPQEIGDCVSQGAKHATEMLTCTQTLGQAAISATPEKVIAQARLVWRPVFAPYYYGSGRIYVGNGQMGNGDGSFGSWQAAAVMQYGTLFADEQGVPAYNGQVAQQFGTNRRVLDQWLPTAKNYLVKSAAKINNLSQLKDALASGYPVTTASNIGYSMQPGRDGFHIQNDNWGHQMCIAGYEEEYDEEYYLIMNSWGDVHGRLKEFKTGEDLPVGVLRVKARDMQKHFDSDGENYAFSSFDGFPDKSQALQLSDFMLIGN
jgi:hypothetical protein